MSQFRIRDKVIVGNKHAKKHYYENIAGQEGVIVGGPERRGMRKDSEIVEPAWDVKALSTRSGNMMTMFVHSEDLFTLGNENAAKLFNLKKEVEI